jgi:dipeptidyl aminopeptidase/acylaminoacyl peptidase
MSVPIIPRKSLFGNPDRASVQLSPDGSKIAYLAPLEGVLNVWVTPRDDLEAVRPITHDTGRGIRFYGWAFTNQHILYIQDKNGDENWRLYCVELVSDQVKDLTPFEGVQAQILQVGEKYPQEAIVALNNRRPEWHDVYRIDLITGERTLLQQNDKFMGFIIDHDNTLRGALSMLPDGSIEIYKAGDNGGWEMWDAIPTGDVITTSVIGFDRENKVLLINDSRNRNTSAVISQDLQTREKTLLAQDPQADVNDVLRHPTNKHVQAVSFVYERKRWKILDAEIEPHLKYLRSLADGDVEINSRTLDDRYWIVLYVLDNAPARFYLYDTQQRYARFLFTNRKDLEGQPLAKMNPVVIKSRDGLDLVCYYTLPIGADSDGDGIPDRPLPMVLFPHGGPWGRDFWGYDPWHQWLANRGYVAFYVNFRSSTGFGKEFVNAGDMQWGGKILDDQVDAVRWAVQAGIADPERVGITGGSFGGYSTLGGLTMHPELYACGVDLVGPSNLITLLESVPPYWKPMFELFATRVGDPRTEQGRALLTSHSPLTYVDSIRCPLLIGQGANDPRVKQAESDQIVQAMKAKNIPVTYVLYPDEGHGFARPENNLSFNAIAEAFLARCLGGRFEPIGDDFKGSSLQVLEGIAEVPELAAALDG